MTTNVRSSLSITDLFYRIQMVNTNVSRAKVIGTAAIYRELSNEATSQKERPLEKESDMSEETQGSKFVF